MDKKFKISGKVSPRPKVFYILLFMFTISILGCSNAQNINSEEDKEAIFDLLHQLDTCYKQDGYIVIRALYPEPTWVIEWLRIYLGGTNIGNSDAEIKAITERKAKELENLKCFTPDYTSKLNQRLKMDSVINPGILLTGHSWGDNLNGMMATQAHLDFLPMFETEGYDPIFIENEALTKEEWVSWHKHRITFPKKNKAEYTLLYSEAGISIMERQDAFYIISFIKEDEQWKISDITIREASRKDILEFYDESRSHRNLNDGKTEE
jgi:hypothetical protein